MKRNKTIILADEELEAIKLGCQPTPADPRIFMGTRSEFFYSAIVKANNGKERPDRRPLDTCPVVDEAVCCFCISYDGDSGKCAA